MKIKRIVLPFVLFLTLISTAFATTKPVTDDFLVDTIRQKLAADQVVKGGAIEVIVKKNKAEKIAKKVSGVKSVSNELKISRP
jgi:osmotically-inducible protein OsmY